MVKFTKKYKIIKNEIEKSSLSIYVHYYRFFLIKERKKKISSKSTTSSSLTSVYLSLSSCVGFTAIVFTCSTNYKRKISNFPGVMKPSG